MTELKEKTQNALDRSRTLILGAQILLGDHADDFNADLLRRLVVWAAASPTSVV
jgi:hypothetical protein